MRIPVLSWIMDCFERRKQRRVRELLKERRREKRMDELERIVLAAPSRLREIQLKMSLHGAGMRSVCSRTALEEWKARADEIKAEAQSIHDECMAANQEWTRLLHAG